LGYPLAYYPVISMPFSLFFFLFTSPSLGLVLDQFSWMNRSSFWTTWHSLPSFPTRSVNVLLPSSKYWKTYLFLNLGYYFCVSAREFRYSTLYRYSKLFCLSLEIDSSRSFIGCFFDWMQISNPCFFSHFFYHRLWDFFPKMWGCDIMCLMLYFCHWGWQSIAV
jgi:hypothetical protein